MKGIIAFISSICICILLVGCTTFDEAKAIAIVIKDHPEFPTNPSDAVLKKLPIGGKQGAIANVKFTTKVEKDGKSTYLVTLTKEWGITVNGEYVKSFWKYDVTPNNAVLLESIDNDNLPNLIK
ncbi:hypothetical protein ACHOLT_11845 [Desulfitobacterium sp. Sab5]|uniref:hypothetical protein n=1 Tax=Desulfitobacterium nosdiversum TaxID=3375356 RepID=UPI003CF95EA8